MRQIVVLGLLAVLGWWLYGEYFALKPVAAGPVAVVAGSPANGEASDDAAASGLPSKPLSEIVGGRPANSSAVPLAGDGAGDQALASLLQRINEADPAAIDAGWRLLADGGAAAHLQQQIAEALAGTGGDFDAMLARLGTHNTFLHSARGRRQAEAVLEAAMAMQDAAAVAAGTRLLDLCLRGRIDKGDQEARAFVDQAYAAYRLRADRWLCDPANVAAARSYTVASGDSLNRIARKFRREGIHVDEGTLALLNRIHNKNAIQAGQRIKVPVDPIRSVVEKRSYSLAVYVGDHLLRLYWIGHGQNDKTPVAEFTISEKQSKPQWTAPDGNVWPYGHPNNILGEFFIKFRHPSYTGFGAHGTPMPDTVCTMSSMGCIRMLAPDIAELFEILPRGTKLEVRASEARS